MKKIGKMGYPCEESYYSDDFVDFFYGNGEKLSDDDLNCWAICLNSPWNCYTEEYITSANRSDKTGSEWKSIYRVIGCEEITSEIYGYGSTAKESFDDCINNFNYIQKIYNRKNESF